MNGYDGRYQINNYGEVLSIRQHHDRRRHNYRITKQYLKPQRSVHKHSDCEYRFVTLQKDGVRKTHYIHNLVAQAFIPNPSNLPSVYHIDGDTINNRVDNLKWCSRFEFREITEEMRQSGKRLAEKYAGITKRPIKQYDLDGNFIRQYNSLAEASETTSINMGHISEVANKAGQRKTAGGYYWEYTKQNTKKE